ncbi:MAG: hypothetical protein ACI9V1_003311 [Spirosomataceae bacterium]|jgi:hypothetical protein
MTEHNFFSELIPSVHNQRFKSLKAAFALLFVVMFTSSCGVYSFTGTTLSSEIETITIRNFAMVTAGGPQNMTLTFNEKLKEYYQRNTSLKLRPDEGDLILDGAIVGYELTPVSTTASDKAALNRLSVRIEVAFTNRMNPEEDFEKEFSFYEDFSAEQSLSDVEDRLVPKILDQIVLNIFTETAAQW